MSFQHRPLQEHEIRLLEPAGPRGQHPLQFRVHHVARSTSLPYTAVSYTWGQQSASQSILIDGKKFAVRPNVLSCLHYLSLYRQASSWGYIWVDAVCIDQNNTTEKNQQVKNMDRIYQGALATSVWLGMPHEGHGPGLVNDEIGWDWTSSMPDLANRPYWSRVWVIQEFLLSQHIEIFCGGYRIDWQAFRDRAGEMIGKTPFIMAGDEDTDAGSASHCAAVALLARRHPDAYPELAKPLHELLTHHRLACCTDPRDRVFALLGMIPREERDVLLHIFPNYDMSVDEVRIVTITFLRDVSLVRMSDDLFDGLGVTDICKRKKLLLCSQHVSIEDIVQASHKPRLAMARLDELVGMGMTMQEDESDDEDLYGPPLAMDRDRVAQSVDEELYGLSRYGSRRRRLGTFAYRAITITTIAVVAVIVRKATRGKFFLKWDL